MELVNQTPLPAKVTVTRLSDTERGGIITAKATFCFSPGETALDTQAPFPLSLEPVVTELGLLPPDLPYQVADERFEVVVLGCAHAPSQEPVTEMRVAVSVGDVRRELVVTGDRSWAVHDGHTMMSSPVPFSRMPLTWERAFGGRCKIEVDDGAFVVVADPINPAGRGYDVARDAQAQAEYLEAPPGFPRYEYERLLPNLERPDERVATPEDRPRPACWATRPIDSGLRAEPLLQGMPDRVATAVEAGRVESAVRVLRSACDEWVIDRPPAAAAVTLEGLAPGGAVSFPLPQLSVHADYSASNRRGTVTLRPQRLVLLPEEQRLMLTYRAMFRVPYVASEERSLRLRLGG
ncbi:MAG: DUF2169 domain-containing protein [Deltaproteobacteria bacterium]|nr:DUF2169 domain-containing protein [Deltaproteobacteria bacterium]